MIDQENLDKNIIDEKLLENPADANQNVETEDASTLKENEEKEKSLEEEISQALKLLRDNKLSPSEYQELYKKAFSAAENLLKADLELAQKFKNLPTSDGFRSDKYKLKLSKDYIKAHNEFYQNALLEPENKINKVKLEIHAYEEYQKNLAEKKVKKNKDEILNDQSHYEFNTL